MDNHTATEIAYKNGYEQGKKDAVKHGRWIETKNGFHCSNCKRKPGQHPTKRGVFLSDYCPNCGAKMDAQ